MKKKFNIVFFYFSEIENVIHILEPIKRRVKVWILHLSNQTFYVIYILSIIFFTLKHGILKKENWLKIGKQITSLQQICYYNHYT